MNSTDFRLIQTHRKNREQEAQRERLANQFRKAQRKDNRFVRAGRLLTALITSTK